MKFLNENGVQHLWKKISLEDYPNNETLIAVLNAIDDTKADKSQLNDYLTKKDYIAGESGGSIDLSNFLSKEEAQILYAPKNILETVYPVGAIYISVNQINPATLFGFGTWNQIEDKFLLAAGPTYTAGSTGGEAEHTLTELEMPAHDHEFNRHQLWKNEQVPPSTTSTSNGYGISWTTLPIYTDKTVTTGGGESHNNMPPYLTVYMWQRIN